MALAMPHSSGQQIAAWSPAATPRRVWPSMMRAVRPTTDTSASSAATSPAPTAGPWMADTIGVEQSMRFTTRSRASRITRMPGVVVGDRRLDQVEAPAGGEPAPGAPQERHVHVGVAVDGAPHVGELRVRRGVDRVEARARRA